jgi:hypothetical protein
VRWKQEGGFVSNNCTYPPPVAGYAQLSCVYLGVMCHYDEMTMTDRILGLGQYHQEEFDDLNKRYSGFGKEIYTRLKSTLPSVFDKLTYYRSLNYQTNDSYAVFKDGDKVFAIQLDPLCEVIVLWNDEKQVEIGTWSADEYGDAISFIKTELIN